MRRKRLTLSVEATELRGLVAQGERIVSWASRPLPGQVVANGQIARPGEFGAVVRALVDKLEGPRKAVVSLSARGALVRVMDMPSVPSDMMEEAVRREARRELPLPLEELYLSWQGIGEQSSGRTRVCLIGTPRQAVDNCVAGLREAGIRPVAIDLKPLALLRAVNRPDVLLANLEEQAGGVVLARHFVPYVVRSTTFPGQAPGSPTDRADGLIVEIRRTLDFYRSTLAEQHPDWTPVACLTGEFGTGGRIRSQIESQWALVEPQPPLTLPEALPLQKYLVNVGLVLKSLS